MKRRGSRVPPADGCAVLIFKRFKRGGSIMKQILFFVLLLSAAVSGPGFAADNSPENRMDRTLYENCLELISLMHETACNETYASLVFGSSLSDEAGEPAAALRNSRYGTPEAVWQLVFPETGILLADYFANLPDTEDAELSPRLKNKINAALVSAVGLQLTAVESGVPGVTAANAYTGELVFTAPGVKGNSAYLFVYKDSVPVYIAVTAGKDGAVKIQGTYIFWDTTESPTREQLCGKLSPFGIPAVTEVTLP